jgi:hypothetical protein
MMKKDNLESKKIRMGRNAMLFNAPLFQVLRRFGFYTSRAFVMQPDIWPCSLEPISQNQPAI